MTIDRAEQAGFGVSAAGHLLLFGLLVAGYAMVPPIKPPKRTAVEVSLVAETALESGAPQISQEVPAPKLAEVEAPLQPEPPAPTPVEIPRPVARAEPKPTPAPAPKPAPPPLPKAAAKPVAQARPTPPAPAKQSGGRLAGILNGLSDRDAPSRSTAVPAATISPAIQSSLAAAIIRQIKPHWEGPSGPDVDALKTVLKISLARDGTVTAVEFVGTTGINSSNRSIAPIHRERAEKAVRLASPFQLPPNLYDGWKQVTVNFDWRL